MIVADMVYACNISTWQNGDRTIMRSWLGSSASALNHGTTSSAPNAYLQKSGLLACIAGTLWTKSFLQPLSGSFIEQKIVSDLGHVTWVQQPIYSFQFSSLLFIVITWIKSEKLINWEDFLPALTLAANLVTTFWEYNGDNSLRSWKLCWWRGECRPNHLI